MRRIVIDTNVVVAALRSSDGGSAAVMRLVRQNEFKLLATPTLFLEYEDVLKRPEQTLAHGLDTAQIDLFLAALAAICEPISVSYRWRPQLMDAGDEMVLEAAVNGRAEAIVTFNVRHFLPAASTFGIDVVRPGQLVRRQSQ
jgi:putative PIN family toxin of toxin-antitoxin system